MSQSVDRAADFWVQAWALEDLLRQDPPQLTVAAAQLHDIALQRFLFLHREYSDSALMPALVGEGLFLEPPDAADRVTWPIMAYLANVSPVIPDLVGHALLTINTDNPDVLYAGLRVAVTLPEQSAASAVRALSEQWLRSETGYYFDSRLWLRVAHVIASYDVKNFEGWLAAVMTRAASTGATDYEFKEFLSGLPELDAPDVAGHVLDAIGSALAFALTASQSFVSSMRLADLQPDFPSETSAVLARAWLQLAPGTEPTITRASWLLAASSPLLNQLGLRELQRFSQEGPPSRLERLLVGALAGRDDFYASDKRDEFLRLLATHFNRLTLEGQAEVISRASYGAASEEPMRRLQARDIFSALRAHLGPTERLTLQELEKAFGGYDPDEPRFRFSAGWHGSEGPMSDADLRRMRTQDLLALLTQTREREEEQSWPSGPSVGGLAGQLRDLVPERPAEFLDLVQTDGNSIVHPSLHSAIADGLSKALLLGSEDIDAVSALRYMDGLLKRFDSDSQEETGARKSVVWSVLTLVEAMRRPDAPASRQRSEQAAAAMVSVIQTGLKDPSPTQADVQAWQSEDLMSLGLNLNRGIAVRAAFQMLGSPAWVPQRDRARLIRALASAARKEPTAAVLSAFGSSLWLAIGGKQTSLAIAVRDRMSHDAEDFEDWAAIFATYVASYNPSTFDEELYDEYAFALEVRGLPGANYLRHNWKSLLIHEIAAYLQQPDEARWWGLLAPSLDVATGEDLQTAMQALGRSVSEDAGFDIARVVRLAANRVPTVQRSRDVGAASALASMLVESGAKVVHTGGVLLELMRLGGQVDGRDLLKVLQRDAEETPGLVGQLLRVFVINEQQPWFWHTVSEEANSLLRALAQVEPANPDAVFATDALGWNGHFEVEPAARLVRGQAGSIVNEESDG